MKKMFFLFVLLLPFCVRLHGIHKVRRASCSRYGLCFDRGGGR